MIYVCVSTRNKNNVVKVLSCFTVEFNGSLVDYLKEAFSFELENGVVTHDLLDRGNSLYLSCNNKMIYVYLVPKEQEAVLLDSLQSRLINFTSKLQGYETKKAKR